MQVGNSRVKKILMGDKVVYRDSDGWVPLELADGVTGNVMFKDNGDGTAGLIGSLGFTVASPVSSNYGDGHALITAPNGYKFTSADWHTQSLPTKVSIATLGNMSNDSWFGSIVGMAYIKLSDNGIDASSIYCYAAVTKANVIISFNKCSTVTQGNIEDWALPAIVGIEKV